MKLTCPACNEPLSLAALIEHDAAREAINAALKWPAPLGKLLLQYIGLHKPLKTSISMDKVAKILADLLPMVNEGKVRKNGNVYAAPQEYWAQAIETMVANRAALTLPLKSHGYLISIIAGYADKVAATAEKKAEQGRQNGVFHSAPPVIASAARQSIVNGDQFADTGKMVEKPQRSQRPVSLKATIAKLTGKPSHAE